MAIRITTTRDGLGHLIASAVENNNQTTFHCELSLPYVDYYQRPLITVTLDTYNGVYPTSVEQHEILKIVEITPNGEEVIEDNTDAIGERLNIYIADDETQ